MKVAVVGGTGQLGHDIVRVFAHDHEVVGLGHSQIEVSDDLSVREVLKASRPDVVVNCAAFHRVDDCEEDLYRSFQVNAIGQANVARTCRDIKAKCVFVSTDYVFDGSQSLPYHEGNVSHPINAYGASKLAGETLTEQSTDDWVIARVSSLFGAAGSSGKGGNFVETILGKARAGSPLRIVDDVMMSPTYTAHAAELLAAVVLESGRGVFHLANEGSCTWYGFAKAILDLAVPGAEVQPISSAQYPTRAKRPENSSLTSSRLGTIGAAAKPWPDGLAAYLEDKGHV